MYLLFFSLVIVFGVVVLVLCRFFVLGKVCSSFWLCMNSSDEVLEAEGGVGSYGFVVIVSFF